MGPINGYLLFSGPTGDGPGTTIAILADAVIELQETDIEAPDPIEIEVPDEVEIEVPDPVEIEAC